VTDVVLRTNVWSLEGETVHKQLLDAVVSADALEHAAVVITLDYSTPWNLLSSLKKWLALLEERVSRMDKKKFARMQKAGARLGPATTKFVCIATRRFLSYNGTSSATTSSSSATSTTSNAATSSTSSDMALLNSDSADDESRLGGNVLTHNLGLPLIICCCKVRFHSVLRCA
jgi:dynein light intermediate chain 1